MVRHRKEARKIPIKEIGLNVELVNDQALEELAELANNAVRLELEKVFPIRDDYIVTSSMEFQNNSLTVTFDVVLNSPESITPEESALIEEAIDKGLEVIEIELARRYGGSRIKGSD